MLNYSRIWLDTTACLHLLATSIPQTFCVCNWTRCVCGEREEGGVVLFKFTLLLFVCTLDLFLTITEIMYMYYLRMCMYVLPTITCQGMICWSRKNEEQTIFYRFHNHTICYKEKMCCKNAREVKVFGLSWSSAQSTISHNAYFIACACHFNTAI